MYRLTTSLIVLASLSLAACGAGEGDPNDTPDAGGTPSQYACSGTHNAVTAQKLYTDIVATQCQRCHFPGAPDNSLVLDSAAALKEIVGTDSTYGSGLKVVEANKAENSTLYLKVLGGQQGGVKGPKGQAVGQVMPFDAPQLSDAQKAQIQDWICTGAQ